jgi:hypothetical protein
VKGKTLEGNPKRATRGDLQVLADLAPGKKALKRSDIGRLERPVEQPHEGRGPGNRYPPGRDALKGSPVIAAREGDLAAGQVGERTLPMARTLRRFGARLVQRERRPRPQAHGARRNPGEPSQVDATREEIVGANSQDEP